MTLLVIFIFITLASNWGSVGELTGDAPLENKLVIAGEFLTLTPHRIAHSAYDSFTYWQQTGNPGALGASVLYGASIVFLFLFLVGLIGWSIGFVRPLASEERKSFVAFVATLALLALAIGIPFDPDLAISAILLIVGAWICVKLLSGYVRGLLKRKGAKKVGEGT